MKSSRFLPSFVLAILLSVSYAQSSWAQATPISVDPPQLLFDAHDIGTANPRILVVRNTSSESMNVDITLVGEDPSEFTWNSSCLRNLPASSSCEVTVSFDPTAIRKTESRSAQLRISGRKGESQTVDLTGSAYQNLGVSPARLSFGDQTLEKSSTPQTVTVTNYSDVTISNLAVATTSDFIETHAKCEKITPGASCAISVSFAPKVAGVTSGSLTITADQSPLGKSPRVIVLAGNGLTRCKVVSLSFWSWNVWLVLIIGGLYFVGLVMVRWHMIAKPARAQLVTQVNAVRALLRAESAGIPSSPDVEARIARIDYLLDWAVYPFKNKNFPVEKEPDGTEKSYFPGSYPWYTRLFNAIFWPRGQELAGWSCSHEAELLLVELLPVDSVRARMETAEQRLRLLNNPVATSVAELLRATTSSSAVPVPLERWRALLVEALAILYERGDREYFELATWHSKMMWLVGSALLFIFGLAAALQNAVLLLLGGVGGLLSRLARTVSSAETGNDYGASWGTLFLSPLSGAISAWGGILLIILGLKFNIFGSALHVDWCNPYDPGTLAIALLFGFCERLFDGLATQIEQKVVKTQPDSPPTPPAKPAPTIASVNPSGAARGVQTSFKVTGSNFLVGAAATLTDEHGNPMQVKLEYQDATAVLITGALTGANPFTTTLTITNPDKQSTTFRFNVT